MKSPVNQHHLQTVFHPGETLAEKLEEMEITSLEFALLCEVPEKTVLSILKCEIGITIEMAEKFEKVLKIPVHFWVNKQRRFDEFLIGGEN